jgi:amidophosphoribosyltransferase
MAGIVGLFGYDTVWKMARFIYYSLMALQHRGQETCGIATFNGESLFAYKASGLVDRVFTEEKLEKLPGWIGIGHVSSSLEKNDVKIQPTIACKGPVKLALCYDGIIMNRKELMEEEKLNAESDQEVFAEILSRELAKSDPLEAFSTVAEKLRGRYAFIALTENGEMLAGRDATGMKPLVIGNFGFDYGAVASESCVLDVIGADYKADVKPGEVYLFTSYSIERKQVMKPKPKYCAFEYVYFARPDSVINERSLYEVRVKIGEKLAEEAPVENADVIIGIPETAIPFAMAFSNKTKKPIGMGFVQTGGRVRSAIKPTQFERLVGVQLKLNPIKSAISGKRIVLVDDSVVRGTTTKNTVNIMRNRIGAKEVHVRVGSPRLVAPCPFGVEVPSKDELIAANLSEDEVSKVVGADTFHWLSLEGLIEALRIPKDNLCLGCFTGEYAI